MGRNLSPILRQELANLDKDADSRKSAMKALKSYVKDLDSKAIPVFLAKVSETKETGEYTISLYEVLARVHGVKIVPQIGSIMSTIVKTLASSAGSFPLQQACSKVVPAIAKYGIDPLSPEDEKRHIINLLCKPLSESVLSSQESLSSGAALCLKALVESDNWRFASNDTVNKVCQSVTGALEEKSSQTNAHMGLVMALAKCNAPIVEAYARLLIKSGLRISNAGITEGNSQKRFSAIQMINFLMKSLDPWSLLSEVVSIMEEMEKCQSDPMAYVKGAAYEALQTAKKIAKGSNSDPRDHSRRKNLVTTGDRSRSTASPESKTLDYFMEYESLLESPISSTQISCTTEYDRRSVNRKLWSNNGSDYIDEFAGLLNISTSPSPTRSRSCINMENLFTTPRKLLHSLQDPNSDYSEKHSQRLASPRSEYSGWNITTTQSDFRCGMVYEIKGKGHMHTDGEEFHGVLESMSSTDDNLADIADVRRSCEAFPSTATQEFRSGKACKKTAYKMAFALFLILVAVLTALWTEVQDESFIVVPT
ncbi:short-chain dehydrogenase/reductase family protein [Hibiscus syriacus]|uniref:Short-chain dehydrogenase/reductase family protein n=1 Tax=Hibiscus syriacus TaxID=106335 RepID=A0A6A3C7X4_HIBSY|nr:short-chain dehydrogenase/reductase family protein [Hibiscus syriacus]